MLFSKYVHRTLKEQDSLVRTYDLPNRLAAQYLEFLNNVLEEQLDVEVPLSRCGSASR